MLNKCTKIDVIKGNNLRAKGVIICGDCKGKGIGDWELGIGTSSNTNLSKRKSGTLWLGLIPNPQLQISILK